MNVSVLLPYRDAAATLQEAIESVLQEDVREVIAIDDGSRDGGVALDCSRQGRVVQLRTPGIGIAGALALGMKHARGELIARMDADDVSLPGRITTEVEMLERDPSLAVAACQIEAFGAVTDGMRAFVDWQNAVLTPDQHPAAMFIDAPVCHPSVTMRRTAVLAVGGFRDMPWAEDYDLWLRLDAAGFRFAKHPSVMFRWRQHPESATRRDVRCSRARLRAARALYLAPRLRAMGRPLAIWGAGPTGKRLARELEKHDIRTARFIDVDPHKIGRTRRGAPVVDEHHVPADHTVVIAVGARGARDLVRRALLARGLQETRDFIAAA